MGECTKAISFAVFDADMRTKKGVNDRYLYLPGEDNLESEIIKYLKESKDNRVSFLEKLSVNDINLEMLLNKCEGKDVHDTFTEIIENISKDDRKTVIRAFIDLRNVNINEFIGELCIKTEKLL